MLALKLLKFKKVFASKLDFFTFLMTEITILVFTLICMVIYGKEENLGGYLTGDKVYSYTMSEKFGNILFIVCLCLTIFGEFLLACIQLYTSLAA